MTSICLALMLFIMPACTAMSGLFQSVDDIATDNVATATVYKAGMQKDTDVQTQINVSNKDKSK